MRAVASALGLCALLAGAAQGQISTGGGGMGGGMGGGGAHGAGPPAVTALATGRHDGAEVAVVGRADGRVGWARLDLETEAGPVPEDDAGRLPGAVIAVAVAPDGAAWALDDAGGLYRVAPGVDPVQVAAHEGGAQALALAPDGALAATAGNDGVVRVWATGPDSLRDQVAELKGHEGPVAALCWTDAGLWSAGWDGEVRAWSVKGRRIDGRGRPTRVSARELCAIAAGSDGLLVTGGFDGALTLVDPGKRKTTTWPERPNPEMVRALVTAPDGSRALALLPGEAAVVLLLPDDPAAALRWVVSPTDGRPPSAVAFTPDGLGALVGRYDGSLRRLKLPEPPAGEARKSLGGRP